MAKKRYSNSRRSAYVSSYNTFSDFLYSFYTIAKLGIFNLPRFETPLKKIFLAVGSRKSKYRVNYTPFALQNRKELVDVCIIFENRSTNVNIVHVWERVSYGQV